MVGLILIPLPLVVKFEEFSDYCDVLFFLLSANLIHSLCITADRCISKFI